MYVAGLMGGTGSLSRRRRRWQSESARQRRGICIKAGKGAFQELRMAEDSEARLSQNALPGWAAGRKIQRSGRGLVRQLPSAPARATIRRHTRRQRIDRRCQPAGQSERSCAPAVGRSARRHEALPGRIGRAACRRVEWRLTVTSGTRRGHRSRPVRAHRPPVPSRPGPCLRASRHCRRESTVPSFGCREAPAS